MFNRLFRVENGQVVLLTITVSWNQSEEGKVVSVFDVTDGVGFGPLVELGNIVEEKVVNLINQNFLVLLKSNCSDGTKQ
jgi:hypothetical protein